MQDLPWPSFGVARPAGEKTAARIIAPKRRRAGCRHGFHGLGIASGLPSAEGEKRFPVYTVRFRSFFLRSCVDASCIMGHRAFDAFRIRRIPLSHAIAFSTERRFSHPSGRRPYGRGYRTALGNFGKHREDAHQAHLQKDGCPFQTRCDRFRIEARYTLLTWGLQPQGAKNSCIMKPQVGGFAPCATLYSSARRLTKGRAARQLRCIQAARIDSMHDRKAPL